MTSYEMAELFMVWATFIESTGEQFIALLFAFLVSAYLVSAKLQRSMVVIVIVLYSYMAIRQTLLYFNVSGDLVALAEQIRVTRAQAGVGLEWLDISTTLPATYYAQVSAMFLSYLASLVFFFYTRHHPRRGVSS